MKSPATRTRQHGKAKLLAISAVVVVAAIGSLVYSSMADAEYYKHVHEVMAAPEPWVGRNFKLHGKVEPGSIREAIVGQKTQRSFVLEFEGQRVAVRSEGPKPDTFKDLAEVVAQGRLTREGEGATASYVFVATDLSAKCPSKYEENQRSTRPAPRDTATSPAGAPAAASPR